MRTRRWPRAAVGAAVLALVSATAARSATPLLSPPVTLTAEVTLGGPNPFPDGDGFTITHTPLERISPITRIAIVAGQAGTRPVAGPSAIAGYETPEGEAGAGPTDGEVRARVLYRVWDPGHESPGEVPESDLPWVAGDDPLFFAFQIPPEQLTKSGVAYRIEAVKVAPSTGSAGPVTLTASYPPTAGAPGSGGWVEAGVRANAADRVDASGGRFVLPDGNPFDGTTRVDVPAGLLAQGTTLTIDELAPDSPFLPARPGGAPVLAAYALSADPPVTGVFLARLLYQDFQFPDGQDGRLDATGEAETGAGVEWWDGTAWIRLSSRVNPGENTVGTRIGAFSYLVVVPPGAPSQVRPAQRIITPNGDGTNDVAFFSFPPDREVRVTVYDAGGRRIRSFSSGSASGWDGRDDAGGVVESGVYLYQYELDGQRVSGVIAVAR